MFFLMAPHETACWAECSVRGWEKTYEILLSTQGRRRSLERPVTARAVRGMEPAVTANLRGSGTARRTHLGVAEAACAPQHQRGRRQIMGEPNEPHETSTSDEAMDERQRRGEIHPILADLIPTPPAGVLREEVVAAAAAKAPSIVAGTIKCLREEAAMVADAYSDLNKVLASDLFRMETLAAAFTEANGLDSLGVYDLVVSRSPITVDLTMFTGTKWQNYFSRTMGYEDPNHPTVCFANRHFIRSKELCASLILHETMHVVGFPHAHAKNTSVPYTMNRIYEKVSAALSG
jgi:hypothetical protein